MSQVTNKQLMEALTSLPAAIAAALSGATVNQPEVAPSTPVATPAVVPAVPQVAPAPTTPQVASAPVASSNPFKDKTHQDGVIDVEMLSDWVSKKSKKVTQIGGAILALDAQKRKDGTAIPGRMPTQRIATGIPALAFQVVPNKENGGVDLCLEYDKFGCTLAGKRTALSPGSILRNDGIKADWKNRLDAVEDIGYPESLRPMIKVVREVGWEIGKSMTQAGYRFEVSAEASASENLRKMEYVAQQMMS